jgi:acetylornithine deacetylase
VVRNSVKLASTSPGDISQAHQPDEFVARSQMDACDAFLGKMIGWAERQ